MEFTGIQIDPKRLMSMREVMDELQDNGEDYQALTGITNRYLDVYNNELAWHYPISDGRYTGAYLLCVQEGFLYLPYNAVHSEDYELFELVAARLVDADEIRYLADEWKSYSAALTGALEDMLRILQRKS
jgi:hypothetical protein